MDWNTLQEASFYEASARQRAVGLLDAGSFTEFVDPSCQMTSTHLELLGEAVSFDDGVSVGIGRINGRPVFVVSQEGRFIGGAVGEMGGAKIVGAFQLALRLYDELLAKDPNCPENKRPAIVYSFETGGVRLHEANAGLLAHAEVMEMIGRCRGKVPVLALVGSKVGCFGGMGFVSVAADCVIMSELGRIGLTGPEVIEEVMGKKEFDAANRALVYRTTGGKHKYIMGDAAYLVADSIAAFRAQTAQVLALPYADIAAHRVIGTRQLAVHQLELVALAARLKPADSTDVWAFFGNQNAADIPDMSYETFMSSGPHRAKDGWNL